MASKPDIPLPIIVTHDENSIGGPLLVLENLWPEKGRPQTNVPYTLHNMPGVETIEATLSGMTGAAGSSGPTGIFSRDGYQNGATFIFTQDRLLRDSPAAGYAPIAGGEYETNNTRSIEHAAIRQYLFYIEGTTGVSMDNGATRAAIAGLPATVTDVATIAKRAFFISDTDDIVHFTDLDTAIYNALNTFQTEVTSDSNKSIYAHSNTLYIAGSQNIELHRPVPDPDLPVAYTGVAFPFGAPCPAAWADTLGHCFTIGQDDKGSRGIYKIKGGSYEKISPHWLDRRLELLDGAAYPASGGSQTDISSIERCVGNAYTSEGHSIYELHIPGVVEDGVDYPPLTIAYDVTSGAWIEITSVPATASAASAQNGSVNVRFHGVDAVNSRHYVVEATSQTLGNIEPTNGRWGVMQRETLQYFGADQRWQWCAFQSTEKVFQVDDVEQQLSVTQVDPLGTTKDTRWIKVPKATINAYSVDAGALYDYSDDLGMTFQPARTVTFNLHGKRAHRLASRRGGEVLPPGRIHRWRINYPGNVEIGPMFINIDTLM